MNYLKTVLFLLLITQHSIAQDIKRCKTIVNATIESINTHTSEPLNPYLAEDFAIAGQKGPPAKKSFSNCFLNLMKP